MIFTKYITLHVHTVGENIIATTKIRNNYCGIQSLNFQYCDSSIGLFSIAPCKVIILNLLNILFCISSLLLFIGSLSKVIALKGDSEKITNTFR